jgi:PAS domain S-box-containing protein
MTAEPVTMKIDMSLETVEEIFIKKRITVAPVLDIWSQVLGVISDFTLVKMFLKRASKKDANANLGNFLDYLEPVVLVDENQPMIAAFKLMLQSPNHRVFATRNGKISGVLSPKDMLPYLVGEKTHHKSAHEEQQELRLRIETLLQELSASKKQLISYKNFFNDSPFMMHSSDFDGNILMANKIMHYTLGYHPGELVGEPISKIYSHQNHQDAANGLEMIKTHGFHPPVSTLMVKKNMEILKVDVASMAKRDENEKPIGTITISQLTEGRQMMDILREAVFLFQEERKNAKNKVR